MITRNWQKYGTEEGGVPSFAMVGMDLDYLP